MIVLLTSDSTDELRREYSNEGEIPSTDNTNADAPENKI